GPRSASSNPISTVRHPAGERRTPGPSPPEKELLPDRPSTEPEVSHSSNRITQNLSAASPEKWRQVPARPCQPARRRSTSALGRSPATAGGVHHPSQIPL